MDKNADNCLVLDVGKTNVKIHVLDRRHLLTHRCAPTEIEGLDDYCTAWHEKIGGIT